MALAANAQTADSALACLPYMPDQVSPPVFYVATIETTFHQSFGGQVSITYHCMVLVSRSDPLSAAKSLCDYMSLSGPKSICDALESDSQLGGACDDLIVRGISGHRWYEFGEQSGKYLGAEWLVDVKGDPS